MNKKQKTVFVCKNCGYDSSRWLGKCPECGQWNTFIEEKFSKGAVVERRLVHFSSEPVRLGKISDTASIRLKTGIGEFDRILGGGIMPASIVLLGGPPGIGKSTLMLQVAEKVAGGRSSKVENRAGVLYVSGEESLEQIKGRALRLSLKDCENLMFMSETNVEKIIDEAEKLKPAVLVVDSIQTVYKNDVSSSPGSVTQVRECA
ncbi:MAG: AAA family ATPase, partial [Elusimicrobiota bacterium]